VDCPRSWNFCSEGGLLDLFDKSFGILLVVAVLRIGKQLLAPSELTGACCC